MRIGPSFERMAQTIGCIVFTLFAVGLSSFASGQIPADKLLQSLRPTADVNDYANILSATEKATLEERCRQLRERSGAQLTVVIINSLQGGQIDDFAVKLFKQWRIGQQGKNNGVLLLVALDDRKARIEVGYGLEPILPDALAGRILDQQLLPAFKQQRYYDGLQAAVGKIAEIVERNEPASAVDRREAFRPDFLVLLALFLTAFVAAGGYMFGRGAGFQDGILILFGALAVAIPLLADCGLAQGWAILLHLPVGLVLAWLGWRSAKKGTKYWPDWTDVSTDPWMWGGTGGGWSDWSSGGSGGFSGGDWGGFGGGESGGGGASGGW